MKHEPSQCAACGRSEGLVWILGKFPYGEGYKTTFVGNPGQWRIPHPWKCGKNMAVALGTVLVLLGDGWSFPPLTIPSFSDYCPCIHLARWDSFWQFEGIWGQNWYFIEKLKC